MGKETELKVNERLVQVMVKQRDEAIRQIAKIQSDLNSLIQSQTEAYIIGQGLDPSDRYVLSEDFTTITKQ